MANINRPSFIAEPFSVSEFSSVEKAILYGYFLYTVLDKALHASVVCASGSGQLQANPHVAGPWLSPGKPTRMAVTTMGSNDLVVGEVHML